MKNTSVENNITHKWQFLKSVVFVVSVAFVACVAAFLPTKVQAAPISENKANHWENADGKSYWYEGGVRQGTYDDPQGVVGDGTVRGREIFDPDSDGWYWLDAVYDGAKACSKEVWMPYIYQNEKGFDETEIANNAAASGDMSGQVAQAIREGTGKWVRYDADGKMYKGWYTVKDAETDLYPSQAGNTYYYDPKTGLMAKGTVSIDGKNYTFNPVTGVLLDAGSYDSEKNQSITYGAFVKMIVETFYPEELARTPAVKDDSPYGKYIRIAYDRRLLIPSPLDYFLNEYAHLSLLRIVGANIAVRVMDDACVPLPSEESRLAAASKMSDYDEILGSGECWAYSASMACAAGLMELSEGADGKGSFQYGSGQSTIMTQGYAEGLCSRLKNYIDLNKNDINAFQITFEGNWTDEQKKETEKEFYTVYPRLWARWGDTGIQKQIRVIRISDAEMREMSPTSLFAGRCAWENYDHRWERHPRFIYLVNESQVRKRSLAHELTHVVQSYAAYTKDFESTWWMECMADYGRCRYFSWSDPAFMYDYETHKANEKYTTWHYEKNVTYSHWFFAYMDDKYPTTLTQYGLIDSIHLAIKRGEVHSDGGTDQHDANFNAVVKRVTGYDNIEELRQKYVQEVKSGTWKFRGYGGYADNYITENLPGVPNPTYPVPD